MDDRNDPTNRKKLDAAYERYIRMVEQDYEEEMADVQGECDDHNDQAALERQIAHHRAKNIAWARCHYYGDCEEEYCE